MRSVRLVRLQGLYVNTRQHSLSTVRYASDLFIVGRKWLDVFLAFCVLWLLDLLQFNPVRLDFATSMPEDCLLNHIVFCRVLFDVHRVGEIGFPSYIFNVLSLCILSSCYTFDLLTPDLFGRGTSVST